MSFKNRILNYMYNRISCFLAQFWVKKVVSTLISRYVRTMLIRLFVGFDAWAINLTEAKNPEIEGGPYEPMTRNNSRVIIMS